MQIGVYQFKAPLWSIVVTLILLTILLRLGFWQLDRAEEKKSIQAHSQQFKKQGHLVVQDAVIFENLPEYQKLEMTGHFLKEKVMFLDNKPYNGVHGYHVITPFKIMSTQDVILVNRGWVPMRIHREQLPDIETSDNQVTIKGTMKIHSAFFTLGENINENNQWPWRIQWLEIEGIEKQLGMDILPFILLQDMDKSSNFIRDWKIIVSPAEKNISYAVQWFALASALLIIFIIVNTKKMKSE